MNLRTNYAAAALILAAVAVPAEAQEMRVFDHDVAILGAEGGGERLLIDGREVHRDWYLSIDEILVVAGAGVVVGFSSPGGNACNGSPFILSFSLTDDTLPRIDGPLPTCSTVTQTVLSDQIRFETAPSPARAGQAWTWTPAAGVQAMPDIPFAANTERGWLELRERTAAHPADLFEYAVIAQQIFDLLGDRRDQALSILQGPGSARFEGDMFVGTSCQAHNCNVTGALLVADIATTRVFLAYKPDNGPLVVLPSADDWPDGPRSQLVRWSFWNSP